MAKGFYPGEHKVTKGDLAFHPSTLHASWCQHAWCPPSYRESSIDKDGSPIPGTTCSCHRSRTARLIRKIKAAS